LLHPLDRSSPSEALAGHPCATTVAVSPDNRWLATGTWQGTGVRVWDLVTRNPVHTLPVEGNAVCAFSPDGRWLVTGSAREYRFWAVGSWQKGLSLTRDRAGDLPGALAFSPDGALLARLHGRSRGTKLLAVSSNQEIATLDTGRPLCFSADGSRLATEADDLQGVQIWDLPRLRSQLAKLRLDWDLPAVGNHP
jgi:WD40 repeat protein